MNHEYDRVTTSYSANDNVFNGDVQNFQSNNVTKIKITYYQSPELRNFLSPLNPEEGRHAPIRRKLTEGTGDWLLKSEDFLRWKSGEDAQVLCLLGEPGTGKSSIMSQVIEDLRCEENNRDSVVSFVYCDYVDRERQTACNLAGAFLWRVLTYLKPGCEIIQKLQERQKHGRSLVIREYTELLRDAAVSANLQSVWLCCDALDELAAQEREEILPELLSLCRDSRFRIFLTGRTNSGVDSGIQRCICASSPPVGVRYLSLCKNANSTDIELFLKQRLARDTDRSSMNDALRKEILDRLAGEQSMFLLATLNIEQILKKRTIRDRRETLRKSASSLDQYYRDSMLRIREEENGIKILVWIYFAMRPLSVDELRYAIAIQPGDKDLNVEEDIPSSSIIESTLGLATVDDTNDAIRFVHYSFNEFLRTSGNSEFLSTGHSVLAQTTATYLTFDALRKPEGRKRYVGSGDLQVFYLYALDNWGHHARQCEDKEVVPTVRRLLESDNLSGLRKLNKLINNRWDTYGQIKVAQYASPLHIVSWFGLSSTLSHMLSLDPPKPAKLNLQDKNGRTPLLYAAKHGHVSIVKQLIRQHGVDVNLSDEDDRSPLLYAVKNAAKEHVEVVKELLGKADVKTNLADLLGWTPLIHAVNCGNVAAVQHLLGRKDVDVNLAERCGRTPLYFAVTGGRVDIVQTLLGRGDIDVNMADYAHKTPLWYAEERGHRAIVDLLIRRRAINLHLSFLGERRYRWQGDL